MSTKISLKGRKLAPAQPGFDLYKRAHYAFGSEAGKGDPPVDLRLDAAGAAGHTRPTAPLRAQA